MDQDNPYAPPAAELFARAPTPPLLVFDRLPDRVGVFRDGDLLVMSKNAPLADHCLKCNAPAGGYRLKRKLSWHHPGVFLLVFINLIIYLIVALVFRKKATVLVPLCPEHRRKHKRSVVLGWTFSLVGLAAMVGFGFGAASLRVVLGEETGNTAFLIGMIVGLIVFIVGLVFAIRASNVASPKKIDDRYVWLRKVSPEFLDGLPPWNA